MACDWRAAGPKAASTALRVYSLDPPSPRLVFRRLWQHVTEALRQKDIEKATEHKRMLEERQRAEERHRAETETAWRTRHFEREVRPGMILSPGYSLLTAYETLSIKTRQKYTAVPPVTNAVNVPRY